MADLIFSAEKRNFEMKRKASFSNLDMNGLLRVKSLPSKTATPEMNARLLDMMECHLPSDILTIQRSVVNHVEYTLARNTFNVEEESMYRAAAYSIRDRLIALLNDTSKHLAKEDAKRCYYLSLEFMTGRAMQNALVNLDLEGQYRESLEQLGYSLEVLYDYEHDAALGNGGLGRLAACFLDSMATLNLPAWGYGIRYNYGIFEQKFHNGWQIEYPDYWLTQDNPWEIQRHDITYGVRFGGHVERFSDGTGQERRTWAGGKLIQAIAYDNPIPGFDTLNCNNLRLWKASPSKEFDFEQFNAGNYMDAITERQDAECISSVLYPNDNTTQGKLLRLKQQYFFVCATLQDILRRFRKRSSGNWSDLSKKVAIQLNDTHPTIAIPELIRILVDVEHVPWNEAVATAHDVFGYTNHTVLPEALEKWNVGYFEELFPRHLEIINELNFEFLEKAKAVFGNDKKALEAMSVYEEGDVKKIRMANLAVIGSHKVNGVAALHTTLVKSKLFPEFTRYFDAIGQPEKFINITNGVTPRRWIYNANRKLSNLISSTLGSDLWLKDLSMLSGLLNSVQDPKVRSAWSQVKFENKQRLCSWIKAHNGPEVDPHMLFDVQVKRIHEYKRQHMNLFYLAHRYLKIKHMSAAERKTIVPRCSMIGGKAAPGYATAKVMIKMINCLADIVNNDPDVSPYFKVFFLPNYNVSSAAIIIPAADINNQISTAGMEASGTSNMKFVMNGSLIIGTLDGATVEIVQQCGEETAFIFGAREPEVEEIRDRARQGDHPIDRRLHDVFEWIRAGHLAQGDHDAHAQFLNLINGLCTAGYGRTGDYYLLCHDFPSYANAQDSVDEAYSNPDIWWKKSMTAVALSGNFSTDRTISSYAELIWDVEPSEVLPSSRSLMSGGRTSCRQTDA